MPAYLIVNYDITDPDGYRSYQKQSAPILPTGARVLVLDPASIAKEGTAGAQTVVIEYPTKEDALAAYEADAYQAVVGLRHGATDNSRAVIVDGFVPR